MQKTIRALEKFFWFYLLLNPFLDIINGVYIWQFTATTNYRELTNAGGMVATPALIVRMAVLIVLAVYILLLRDKKSILTALPMGAAFFLSLLSEFITFGEIRFMTDASYFARFAYNIAIAMVYLNVFRRSELDREQLIERVHKYVNWMLIIFALGIEVPFILNTGYSTYYDRFGVRGTRGFYYSGNDITGAFMLLLPIALAYCLARREGKKMPLREMVFYGMGPAMALLCMALIGTKTAFLGIGVTAGALLIYAIVHAVRGNWESLRRLAIVAVLIAVIVAVLNVLSMLFSGQLTALLSEIAKSFDIGFRDVFDEGLETGLTSGRFEKLAATWQDFTAGGPLAWLFGVGRGSQERIIEMDLCEVFLFYGLFGFVTMLWMYFKYGVEFLAAFFKKFDVLRFGAFLSLGLGAGYLIIAGHILFSVTSGAFFAFVLVYSRLITRDRNQL